MHLHLHLYTFFARASQRIAYYIHNMCHMYAYKYLDKNIHIYILYIHVCTHICMHACLYACVHHCAPLWMCISTLQPWSHALARTRRHRTGDDLIDHLAFGLDGLLFHDGFVHQLPHFSWRCRTESAMENRGNAGAEGSSSSIVFILIS